MKPLFRPSSDKDYILQIKRELEAQVDAGQPLDAATVTAGLLPGGNNTLIRNWAAKNGVSIKDFDAALRGHAILRELGAVPTSPQHLVELVLTRDSIQCRYNGLLDQSPKPRVRSGNKLLDISEDDLSDASVATMVHFTAPSKLTASELALNLRTINANFKLGFTDSSIRDAVDSWMITAKRDRLSAIYMKIDHAGMPRDRKDHAVSLWHDLVVKNFDVSDVSADFVAAILRKFIWSVKRKMRGLPVTNHIMVVILGPQGVGKTVFVNKLIGPVRELSLEVDFAALEESRNIEIWRFFVHVLDEMGYATKADCETIKRVITTETLSRRPMGSNNVETISQHATMIGCSNKELDQLINDPTGNRRFAPVRFRTDADWDAINTTDYTLLWQSVDEHGADPMIEHMTTLAELQAASRQLGPVEEWLEAVSAGHLPHYQCGQTIKPQTLYEQFRDWEREFRPGSRAMDLRPWRSELDRLLKNDKGISRLPFRRADRRVAYGYPLVFQSSDLGGAR